MRSGGRAGISVISISMQNQVMRSMHKPVGNGKSWDAGAVKAALFFLVILVGWPAPCSDDRQLRQLHYNLVQYLGELGADVHVHRNDAISLEQVAAWTPSRSSFRRDRARRTSGNPF